jgi:hypothetical protein
LARSSDYGISENLNHRNTDFFRIPGIRIVKYYAWENAFKNNVENQRDQELKDIYALTVERSATILLMQNIGSLAQGLTLVRLLHIYS